ncbi:DUF4013 domain-containing protein [Haloplanus sp. C73]|uniref:DUF4013 domain-containing protein n=1 Tax=Haloplanus sp. C73 TaxID=3421641 RepID=UPI003EB74DA0
MAIDIEEAVRYPANSDDWLKTVLIGGVLTMLSFLIVPAFFVYGYVIRTLRAGIADEAEPPAFDDWGTLLKEGVVGLVILLVYQLIPLLVMAVTVGGSITAMATGTEAGAGLGLLGLLAGILFSTLLALVFGYVGLIGITNYAHVGSFGAGFDIDVIRDVGLDGAYAVPWVYGIVILIGATAVTSILSLVPVIGAIIGVFITFYGQIAAAWVWGKGFANAMDIASDSPTVDEGDAVGDPESTV